MRKKVAHALCLLWSSASLQKCHHKERSIAAFWKPKLCCLTTVCVVFRAFGAPHVTWGRPVFPLICLLPQKESILWNTLFRYFILICDRSSQGYWSLTQAVIKTQFGGMGEVFCGFQQPRRFSSPFFFSSNIFQLQKMEADAICNSICFESKSRPQSDRIAFNLRQIILMTSTVRLVCCTEASSMAPLTSRPGRCGKSQLFHQSSTNTQIHFLSLLLYWLQHAHIYIYTNKCVTHLLFRCQE